MSFGFYKTIVDKTTVSELVLLRFAVGCLELGLLLSPALGLNLIYKLSVNLLQVAVACLVLTFANRRRAVVRKQLGLLHGLDDRCIVLKVLRCDLKTLYIDDARRTLLTLSSSVRAAVTRSSTTIIFLLI